MSLPPGWKAVAPAIESGQSFVYPVRRVGEGDGPPTHALKRLKSPSRTSRFVREVTTMRRLREDFNIAVPPVVEEDLSEKKPWFAMPWYRDGSLEAAMYTGERWPNLTDRLVLARHVARVLASLHDAGYAHRDLKPANVLLHGDDVVLADFGLCLDLDDLVERLTATSEAIGSRFYIAPENEEGMQEQVDQRPADFYAFGKTLWAMVVRARPLPRETILEPAKGLRGNNSVLADVSERCATALPAARGAQVVLARALTPARLSYATHDFDRWTFSFEIS